MAKTLRDDIPLLDVNPGDWISIHTTVATDPTTGEPTRLEAPDAIIYTGPLSGRVLRIDPIAGPTPGFAIDLDDSTFVWKIRTSRYNTRVTLDDTAPA